MFLFITQCHFFVLYFYSWVFCLIKREISYFFVYTLKCLTSNFYMLFGLEDTFLLFNIYQQLVVPVHLFVLLFQFAYYLVIFFRRHIFHYRITHIFSNFSLTYKCMLIFFQMFLFVVCSHQYETDVIGCLRTVYFCFVKCAC